MVCYHRHHPSVTIPIRKPRRHMSAIFRTDLRTDHWRPTNRSECIDGPRPCPYVGCKYHLFLDVSWSGSIIVNWPAAVDDADGPDLSMLGETCALDVADRGGLTLEDVGACMNLTRERVRQIEILAESRFRRRLRDFIGHDPGAREDHGYNSIIPIWDLD